MKAGRVLVGEGVLTKLCRKKAKPRQFFLFNDILVYGNIVLDKKKVGPLSSTTHNNDAITYEVQQAACVTIGGCEIAIT